MAETSTVRNRHGYDIHYQIDDSRGQALARSSGSVNPPANRLWERALELHAWDTVVDVGANYGEMIATPAMSSARRVMAVEPNPAVAACLEQTVRTLPFDVEIVQAAIGSEDGGSVTLLVDPAWSGKSHLDTVTAGGDQTSAEPISVRMTTLDTLVGGGVPSLCCKVDVEGAEADVLAGAVEAMRDVPRVAMMIEVLHMPMQELERLGRRFPLFLMREDTGELVRWLGKDPAALGRLVHDDTIHRENALILAGSDVKEFTRDVQSAAVTTPRRAVYTAVLGGYEPLREQHTADGSSLDYICFTDDPSMESATWRIEVVTPRFPEDLVRSARYLKTVGHPVLDEYSETLWIDNRVELKSAPENILDELLSGADIAMHAHDFRETVADEFRAVADGGYDDPARVYEQLIAYAEHQPDVLDAKPLWTGIIARRITPAIKDAMNVWMDQILRYSRRDQLSVLVALKPLEERLNIIDGPNRESEWHRWPGIDKKTRDQRSASRAFAKSMRTPMVRLRELETDMHDRLQALEQSLAARTAELESTRRALDTARLDARRVRADRARISAARLQEKTELRAQARRVHNQLRIATRDLQNLESSRSVRTALRIAKLLRGGR